MALNFVGNPYSYYNNRNKTGPLFNGFIYVGIPDLDPTIVANQKAVTAKQEDGTKVAIAQPIRTNSGGYAVDAGGNLVVLLVNGNYSVRVNDKQGNLALEQSDVSSGAPITSEDGVIGYNSLTEAISSATFSLSDRVYTASYRSKTECAALGINYPDGGSANYAVETLDAPDNYGNHAVGGLQLTLITSGAINVITFGALPEGGMGNLTSAPLQAAVNFCESFDSPLELCIPAGVYLCDAPISITKFMTITGAGMNSTELRFLSGVNGLELNTTVINTNKPITLRDFWITTVSTIPDSVGINSIGGTSSSIGFSLIVDRVKISGHENETAWLTAIYLDNTDGVRMTDYVITGITGTVDSTTKGIVATDSTDVVINSGKIYWVGEALKVTGFSEGWKISGHHIVICDYGISIETDGNLFTITENHVSATYHGIKLIEHNAGRANHSYIGGNLVFSDQLPGFDYIGIYIDASQRTQVIGNEVLMNIAARPGSIGLFIGTFTELMVISGNIFGNAGVGIESNSANKITGRDNLFTNCLVDHDIGETSIEIADVVETRSNGTRFTKDGAYTKTYRTSGNAGTVDSEVSYQNGTSGTNYEGVIKTRALEHHFLGRIEPIVDAVSDLGRSSSRWKDIYATNAVINTSDDRSKEQSVSISGQEQLVATQLKGMMKRFKFKDAVSEKGESARWHFGVIAQEVIQAFSDHGLDAYRYGIVCFDEWEDEFDIDGELAIAAGDRYGIRYDELLCFIISAL
jgi:hypothetical protein